MGAITHSCHGLGRDGGSWKRAITVCQVGTLLTRDGTDAVSNLCVAA